MEPEISLQRYRNSPLGSSELGVEFTSSQLISLRFFTSKWSGLYALNSAENVFHVPVSHTCCMSNSSYAWPDHLCSIWWRVHTMNILVSGFLQYNVKFNLQDKRLVSICCPRFRFFPSQIVPANLILWRIKWLLTGFELVIGFITHNSELQVTIFFSASCPSTRELAPIWEHRVDCSVSWSFTGATTAVLGRVISSSQGLYLNTGQY
jgi:hypothetical protein